LRQIVTELSGLTARTSSRPWYKNLIYAPGRFTPKSVIPVRYFVRRLGGDASIPWRLLRSSLAVLFHQRDKANPVKHCGARPQMCARPFSSLLTFRP